MDDGERRRTGRSRDELHKRHLRLQREWHAHHGNRRVLLVSGLPDEQTVYTRQLEHCGFEAAVERSPDGAFDTVLRGRAGCRRR
jgi:hypothetical protein